jgi:hypothetical protein
MKKNESKEPPAKADPAIVQKIAMLGPIGQSLHESLQDMIQESLVRELQELNNCDDGQEENATDNVDHILADAVLASFGTAVSDTNWHSEPSAPPAALLKGRLEYYNRFDGNWDIMVTEAELRPRVMLDPNRKKRPRERPSLWEVSLREERGRPTTALDGNVQILVYDDL